MNTYAVIFAGSRTAISSFTFVRYITADSEEQAREQFEWRFPDLKVTAVKKTSEEVASPKDRIKEGDEMQVFTKYFSLVGDVHKHYMKGHLFFKSGVTEFKIESLQEDDVFEFYRSGKKRFMIVTEEPTFIVKGTFWTGNPNKE